MTRPDRPAQAICRSNAAADCRRPGTRHSGSKIPSIVRAQADVRSRSAPIDGAFGEGRRGVWQAAGGGVQQPLYRTEPSLNATGI